MGLAAVAAVLLAAADGGAPRPPANVIVPESVRRDRTPRPEEDPTVHLGLGAPEVLEAAGTPRATPGSWVEYAVRHRGNPELRVRLSVLPPPAGAAEGRYWLEVAAVGERAFPTVVKLLVHGSPTQPENIERFVLYPAGQAPLELPLDEARDRLHDDKRAPALATVRKLLPADVKVPAGTFHADRLRVTARGGATTVWLARDQVPLWGLVRSQGANRTVELLGYAMSGAHTLVPPAPGEPDERLDAGSYGNGSEYVK